MLLKRVISLVVAVATTWVTYLVYSYLAVEWQSYFSVEPQFWVNTIMLSFLAHEFGHWAMLEKNGVRSGMYFLVLLGGTHPWSSSYERYNDLSWDKLAQIDMAGVAGNFAVIAGAAVTWGLGLMTVPQWQTVAGMNATLVLWNLFPVSITDGGRFIKTLYGSVGENEDDRLVLRIGLPIGFACVMACVLSSRTFLFALSLVLFFWSLYFRINRDNPGESSNRKPMTLKQQKAWAGVFVAFVVASITILATTPSWLKPY